MDTPKKNQARTTPLSKFEDSPVFNFINSLSPIKPVKSIHITHTFNSINFPSILHISPHREFKSPIRTNHLDPSKTTFPSKDETTVSTDEERVVVIDQFSEVSLGNHTEDSNSVFKLPDNVKNDCYIACSNSIVKESSEKVMLEDEGNMERSCKIEQITEAAALDWESSISDGDELLIFRSSISIEAVELIQKPYQITGCTTSRFNPVDSNVRQTTDLVDPVNSYEFMTINSVDTADEEPISSLHRGLRRRCLDFETAGMLVKTADDGLKHSSSLPNEKLATPTSIGSSSFRCTLPGIGLHLNALATKDCKHSIADAENSSSERQLSNPSCSSPFNLPHSSQEPLLTSDTSEREVDINGVRLDDDAFLESAHLLGEELNQINPKKNRQWMENAEKIGACKRCNCKKSRCLKLYCECFAAGVYCIEPCSCQECFNKPIHEDVVLETRRQIESRNPLAFAPKVIVNSDPVSELGDDSNKTPASARHKRGCNCKKSSCLKKYCECYQGGVGCSINCRCEGCKNAFGRKDALTGTETEQEEEEEREICQKSSEMQNEDGQQNNPSCAATLTPPGPSRSLIPLPFEMKRKLPCSFLDDRLSSRLSVRFKLEKQSAIQTQPKIEKNMNMTCEDEVPEIPCMDCSSGSGVQNVSPNSKRVGLPPHRQCEFEPSPSTRIGRRLILQSIPSFPSVPPEKTRVNGPSKL